MTMLIITQSNVSPVGQKQSKLNLYKKGGLFLAVALSASLLTACGGGGTTTTTTSGTTTTTGTSTGTTTGTGSTTTGGTTTGGTTTTTARTFAKIDVTGGDVTAGIERVACVKDSSNGKTWEVKTDEQAGQVADFRDKDYGYFWYDGTAGVAGMTAGTAVTANLLSSFPCQASGTNLTKCDTGSYIKAVNAASLCGKTNWRLPTKDELLGLIDTTRTTAPYIYPDLGSTSFDTETAGQLIRGYWSSTPSATAAATNRLAVSFSKKDDARVQDHAMGNVLNNYVRLIAD